MTSASRLLILIGFSYVICVLYGWCCWSTHVFHRVLQMHAIKQPQHFDRHVYVWTRNIHNYIRNTNLSYPVSQTFWHWLIFTPHGSDPQKMFVDQRWIHQRRTVTNAKNKVIITRTHYLFWLPDSVIGMYVVKILSTSALSAGVIRPVTHSR